MDGWVSLDIYMTMDHGGPLVIRRIDDVVFEMRPAGCVWFGFLMIAR